MTSLSLKIKVSWKNKIYLQLHKTKSLIESDFWWDKYGQKWKKSKSKYG